MKTALICGVGGQDGAYLAQFLLGLGYRVIGTSRDAQAGSHHNLTALGIKDKVVIESMALNDFRSVLHVLAKTRPNEIYNLAGQSSVRLSFEQPVETLESITTGTLNLLEGIRFLDPSIRLYSAGSSECFGNTGYMPADENTPFRPRSPYAVAKACAANLVESYREAYQLFACTGFLFNHESPRRGPEFVTRKISLAAARIARGLQDELVMGNIDAKRDWGFAGDYVDAMWRMLQQDVADDYVVATGETHSVEEFLELAFDAAGVSNWRKYVRQDPEFMRPAEVDLLIGDPTKAREVLGWQPKVSFPELVTMMVESDLQALTSN